MIGAQLNIGESRHNLARRVFFGNLGRLMRGYEHGFCSFHGPDLGGSLRDLTRPAAGDAEEEE